MYSPKPKFDPSRDFVVQRPFVAHGKAMVPNTPFDKSKVDERRLRQLYDQRFVTMAKQESGPAAYLTGLNDDQLREWLTTRGVVPRRGSRDRLLKQAEGVLREDASAMPTLPVT